MLSYLNIYWYLVLMAGLVWGIADRLRRKSQVGSLLLALSRRKAVSGLWIAVGILQVWAAAVSLLESPRDIKSAFTFLCFGIYFLLLGLDRPEFREKGIWNNGLLKWNEIASYAWAADSANKLMVRTRQPIIFGQSLGMCHFLLVPPRDQETVDRILREHLPPPTS